MPPVMLKDLYSIKIEKEHHQIVQEIIGLAKQEASLEKIKFESIDD